MFELPCKRKRYINRYGNEKKKLFAIITLEQEQ